MKLGFRAASVLLAVLMGWVSAATAATAPVTIELTSLRAIQTYNLDDKPGDTVYGFANGVAAGKPVAMRFPEGDKTLPANKKKLAIDDKTPVTVWKGDLADGQFALITVTIFQGDGKDAKVKSFEDALAAAAAKSPELQKPTIDLAGFKALTGDIMKKQFVAGQLLKSQQAVVAKVKDSFSRDKGPEHYSGLFNVVVWNDGTSVRKRLVPVGLTFGEQYGSDVKVYTKLKFTRNNVFVQDEKGEWSTDQLAPLSDDEKTLHVKMLETELIKGKDGNPVRKTTDYLADVQVLTAGQATKWKLEAEVTGVDDIHTYWEFAD